MLLRRNLGDGCGKFKCDKLFDGYRKDIDAQVLPIVHGSLALDPSRPSDFWASKAWGCCGIDRF